MKDSKSRWRTEPAQKRSRPWERTATAREVIADAKTTIDAYRQAEKETYIQFMTDTLMLTLNDPEIMGKDVFGEKRIRKIVMAWGKVYDRYHGALEKGDEADFYQVKMDEALKRLLGEEGFVPFEERYEWIRRTMY